MAYRSLLSIEDLRWNDSYLTLLIEALNDNE